MSGPSNGFYAEIDIKIWDSSLYHKLKFKMEPIQKSDLIRLSSSMQYFVLFHSRGEVIGVGSIFNFFNYKKCYGSIFSPIQSIKATTLV